MSELTIPPQLNAEIEAIAGATKTAANRISFAISLAQGVANRIGALLRLTGDVELVIAAAQAAYDKFAAPLDIPVLTDATEELFDRFCKAAIADILRHAAKLGV